MTNVYKQKNEYIRHFYRRSNIVYVTSWCILCVLICILSYLFVGTVSRRGNVDVGLGAVVARACEVQTPTNLLVTKFALWNYCTSDFWGFSPVKCSRRFSTALSPLTFVSVYVVCMITTYYESSCKSWLLGSSTVIKVCNVWHELRCRVKYMSRTRYYILHVCYTL